MMLKLSRAGGTIARSAIAAAGLSIGFFAAEADAQWRSCGPACQQCVPCYPQGQSAMPQAGQPTPAESMMGDTMMGQPSVDPSVSAPQAQPSSNDFAFGAGAGGGAGGNADTGGYIDQAIVQNRFRLRYDHVNDGDSDFAEFLYGAYGINGRPMIQNYDYDEVSTYVEYMLTCRLSMFAELPVRFAEFDDLATNPATVRQESGLADMNAGFRYALIDNGCDFVTAQFKAYAPTGNVFNGLGNGHVSLQPGLLAQTNYDRLRLFGEIHDWISLSDTVVAGANDPNAGALYGGNVLRYGVGVGYDIAQNCDRRVTLLGEVVGWTVLYGFKNTGLVAPGVGILDVENAAGDTIVNIKTGVRYTQGLHSLYVGYGVPITNDELYGEIIRVDYTYAGW